MEGLAHFLLFAKVSAATLIIFSLVRLVAGASIG